MLDNWEEKVTEYLLDLQAGIQGLKNVAPQTDEEWLEIFRLKKRTVNTLVERVNIDENRELTVRIRLNLLDITDPGPESPAVHFGQFGIYTHIPCTALIVCCPFLVSSFPVILSIKIINPRQMV